MPRMRFALLLPILAALLVPAGAQAGSKKIPIRVGISDQNVEMFDNPAYAEGGFRRVRYFIPWNAMSNKEQRLKARAYVKRARQEKQSVFLHLSTDDFRIKKGELPTPREYKRNASRMVRYFRKLGVRDFGVWNEANHASQPTYRSPRRASQYFKIMYREVKKRCKSCHVVALDVLDQRGVETYMKRFYKELSSTWRKRARTVGMHNYGDVNRKRTKYTRSMIRTAKRYNKRTDFWLTETGGIVNFGKSFPYSESRAKSRLSTMFSLANKFRRSGVERLYIYNWKGAERDARFDAGLTNPDGSPRAGLDYVIKKVKRYLK
ncbi:MAG: hypothetical protein H0V81_08740 [Solirubrobacterales bacterium]|nr:hypothetical protein [Solirubrobacterales bacterium]